MNHPPPPPPPPDHRGPGNPFSGRAPPPPPPPPPNIHPHPPPPSPGGHPGPQFQMQMPMRQQSIRISDISPPKMMDEAACLKKLTTYHAYTLRKVAPRDYVEGPTWAKAEVVEERLAEEDIMREIKLLAKEKKTVTEKKTSLGPNLQNQITTLIDDLASKDPERGIFDWSLVQFARTEKPVPCEKGHKQKYETLTCTVFVKRAPVRGTNPIMLYRHLENMKAQRMQPPPPPPPLPPHHPPEHHGDDHGHGGDHGGDHGGIQIVDLNQENEKHGRPRKLKAIKGKHGGKRYHRDRRSDSSSYSSGSSNSDSESDGYADSLTDTTISSSTGSRDSRGRRYNPSPKRNHSKHRASPQIHQYRIESGSRQVPLDQRPEAYGISSGRQSYVPEVPRTPPVADPRLTKDAVAEAYFAGKEDQKAAQYTALPRSPPPRNIERIAQHVVPVDRLLEPRAVISYRRSEPREEPRYPSRFAELDARDEEARERVRRDSETAQEYMERMRDFPIRGIYAERREYDDREYRRPPPTRAPLVNRPFGVVPPPRRYAPSSLGGYSSGW